MEEIWKRIKDFEDYQVSNLGNVKNNKGRLIGFVVDKEYGYKCICVFLYKNKQRTMKKVHRLVAEAFIQNPDNLPCVDHIDTNTLNNSVENIRWVSYKGNSENPLTKEHQRIAAKERVKKYGTPTQGKKIKSIRKPIVQYTKEGEFIREWECTKDASIELGLDAGSICDCLNNNRNTCGGFKWQRK